MEKKNGERKKKGKRSRTKQKACRTPSIEKPGVKSSIQGEATARLDGKKWRERGERKEEEEKKGKSHLLLKSVPLFHLGEISTCKRVSFFTAR